MKKIYDTVLQAQLRGIEAAKAGVTEPKGTLRQERLSKCRLRRILRARLRARTRIEIHEAPTASPPKTELPEGSVTSPSREYISRENSASVLRMLL